MADRSFGPVLILAVVIGAALRPASAADEAPTTPDKPNILFIFADDFAYDAAGFMGNEQVKTPNLDRLAASGTVFVRAYNPGGYSGAVCISSRMMLNSGRQLWTAGSLHNKAEQEREQGRWWSEHLRKQGYETYQTGKWHIAASVKKSFDHQVHERPGMPAASGYRRPKADGSDDWSPSDAKFGGYWQGGKHWSEVIADDTEAFLEQAGKSDKPFFMYIAFNAPHDPRQAPQRYVDMYPADKIALPEPFMPQYPYMKPIGSGPDLRDEQLAPHPRTTHMVQVHRAEYYAIITHLDDQVGRIMAALERTGKAKDTIVVFTADHGLACGHHGLLGKQNVYDHSVRVPFIVAGRGIEAGRRIDAPIYFQDVMPTSLEWAGVSEKPEHIDFQSFNPILKDPATAPRREAIYSAYLDLQRAITMDGHKLILYPKAKVARLYHLADDPHEANDLAGKAESGPIMRKLLAKLVEMQAELRDTLDLRAAFPEL